MNPQELTFPASFENVLKDFCRSHYENLYAKETTMETTKQEPIKVETGQRWRWSQYSTGMLPLYQQCLGDWWEIGTYNQIRRGWNIAKCSKGCPDHTSFGDDSFANGHQTFLGYAPGYGPQPPTFDPNKVCGAHGQPQFVLGMVLPCASPGCGNGPKGEFWKVVLPADDGVRWVRFTRFAKEIAEGQALWRWKAEPCLDEAGLGSLAAKLRLDGWESAIVKHAAVSVEKKVKKGTQPVAEASGKAMVAMVNAQQREAERQFYQGAVDWSEVTKPGFLGIDRTLAQQLSPAWYDSGPASIQQAIQEAHDQIVAQLGGTPAKMSVILPKEKKPQRREISTDGRHWIDYDRLADADSFDVYPHRRVDGVAVPMMATPPSFKVVGEYGPRGVIDGNELRAPAPRSEFVRLPKPTPWKPSVDETDLLADVG